jgi:hypothetical protein
MHTWTYLFVPVLFSTEREGFIAYSKEFNL